MISPFLVLSSPGNFKTEHDSHCHYGYGPLPNSFWMSKITYQFSPLPILSSLYTNNFFKKKNSLLLEGSVQKTAWMCEYLFASANTSCGVKHHQPSIQQDFLEKQAGKFPSIGASVYPSVHQCFLHTCWNSSFQIPFCPIENFQKNISGCIE